MNETTLQSSMMLMKWAIIVALMLQAGCSGGGAPPVETPDATLSGTITIDGIELADLADASVIGEQDSDKWALRLIDPTESVDSVTLPHLDTSFTDVEVTPIPDGILEIELQPAVDLTGGDGAVTPVVVAIPVDLVAGEETVVTAEITVLTPATMSAARQAAQAGGASIRLHYTYQLNAQSTSALIELDWNGRQLRRDTNRDGSVEDEEYFADSDRNCISDNSQQGMQEGAGSGSQLTSSGVITAVDTSQNTITVDDQDYFVTENSVITDSQSTVITLSALAIGMQVDVAGRRGRHGYYYLQTLQVSAVQ